MEKKYLSVEQINATDWKHIIEYDDIKNYLFKSKGE